MVRACSDLAGAGASSGSASQHSMPAHAHVKLLALAAPVLLLAAAAMTEAAPAAFEVLHSAVRMARALLHLLPSKQAVSGADMIRCLQLLECMEAELQQLCSEQVGAVAAAGIRLQPPAALEAAVVTAG